MKNSKIKSFFAGDFKILAYRFTVLFAIIIPLADTLIFSPLCETVLANIGNGVLYEILVRFSELLVTSAFLMQNAVIISCVFAGERMLSIKLLFLEGLSFLFIATLLKSFVIWLNAFIDEWILTKIGSFTLSNYTLSQVTGESLVLWGMISYFMNVLMLFAVMCVGYFFARYRVRKIKATGRKLSHETLVSGLPENELLKLPVTLPIYVYLATQIVFCILDVKDTIDSSGAPQLLSEYLFLVLPFIYNIGFAIVGYFVCRYVAYAMVSRLNKKH